MYKIESYCVRNTYDAACRAWAGATLLGYRCRDIHKRSDGTYAFWVE